MALFRLLIVISLLGSVVVAARKRYKLGDSLDDLVYKTFPKRSSEEAAVLEWGHSAVISALEAAVAHFGPQTTQAALLEVECMPLLGVPLQGYRKETGEVVKVLDNAEQVRGNIVVLTRDFTTSNVTDWQLAHVAQDSGAAALIVINIDRSNPDDVYRMELPEGESPDEIDIPCVMISMTSAKVLSSATVTEGMKSSEVVNNGMPERIRLYAGGDRPFFEDVTPDSPTMYLIHNILTPEECDALTHKSERSAQLVGESANLLEYTDQSNTFHNVKRSYLWQGLWQTPAAKAVEERLEQVISFPADHFSDFIVDTYEEGSYRSPYVDMFSHTVAVATITIFLDDDGPEIVFPAAKKEPIKVKARKGLAIVHHNTDQKYKFDYTTLHAVMKSSGKARVATKLVLGEPASHTQRIILPLVMGWLGGPITQLHDYLLEQFGYDVGDSYFDKIIMFAPVLLVLGIGQLVSGQLQGGSNKKKKKSSKKKTKKQ